jgi:hypothetical protein
VSVSVSVPLPMPMPPAPAPVQGEPVPVIGLADVFGGTPPVVSVAPLSTASLGTATQPFGEEWFARAWVC